MKINYKHGWIVLVACLSTYFTPSFANERVVADSTSLPGTTYIADEVIAVVGSSMILLSDLKITQEYIEMGYRERGYTGKSSEAEALDALLTQKLLASQAAVDSLVFNEMSAEVDAESKIKSIVADLGSVAQTEKMTGMPIFKLKENLKKKANEREMASAMQQEIQSKITISPAEVNKFYRKIHKDSLPIVPEQYIYAQVAQVPPKTDDKVRMDVKEELMGIRDRISKGTSFAALARMYSDDQGTAIRGGEMDPQELRSLFPEFAEVLAKLKKGQLSEVVETQAGFHIIELLNKQGDMYHFRHILKRVKFTPEQKAEAVTLLDSVLQKVLAGDLAFEKAVEDFSNDLPSKINKGTVLNTKYEMYGGARMKTDRFFKEDLDNDYPYISILEEGAYSPVYASVDLETGDELVKFIKLIKKIPAHEANLREDYAEIESLAKQKKMEEVFNRWISQKIGEIYIRIEEPYKSQLITLFPKWKK